MGMALISARTVACSSAMEADVGFTDSAPEFMTTVAGTRAQRPDTGSLIEKRHEPTNIDVDFVVANPWIY